jgi:hypothetical protein
MLAPGGNQRSSEKIIQAAPPMNERCAARLPTSRRFVPRILRVTAKAATSASCRGCAPIGKCLPSSSCHFGSAACAPPRHPPDYPVTRWLGATGSSSALGSVSSACSGSSRPQRRPSRPDGPHEAADGLVSVVPVWVVKVVREPRQPPTDGGTPELKGGAGSEDGESCRAVSATSSEQRAISIPGAESFPHGCDGTSWSWRSRTEWSRSNNQVDANDSGATRPRTKRRLASIKRSRRTWSCALQLHRAWNPGGAYFGSKRLDEGSLSWRRLTGP